MDEKRRKDWSYIYLDEPLIHKKFASLHALFVANSFKEYAEYGQFRVRDSISSLETKNNRNDKYDELTGYIESAIGYGIFLFQRNNGQLSL